MLEDRVVNEETLGEIESLFNKGTKEPVLLNLIPFLAAVVVPFCALVVDGDSNFPRVTLSLIQVCVAFGLAYSAVAVGLLIAGFSIIAAGLSDRITLALSRVSEPVPTSNLLAFIYSIFVHALLVYWRLFLVCFAGLLFTSGERVLFFFKGTSELAQWGTLPSWISAVVLCAIIFVVTKSVLYLRSFIKNLHATLATVAETQKLLAEKVDEKP